LAKSEDDENENNFCNNDDDENDKIYSKIRHKQLILLPHMTDDATGKFSTHRYVVVAILFGEIESAIYYRSG